MDDNYKTPDLYIAAYLQTMGIELKGAERFNNSRVFFVFGTNELGVRDLMGAWTNNSAKVDARTYADNIKNLKSLVHTK